MPIAQWIPAQWTLFSKTELIDIDNTRYRHSSVRYSNSISFSYLFPTEDRVQRYRAQIERALREAWAATMSGWIADCRSAPQHHSLRRFI